MLKTYSLTQKTNPSLNFLFPRVWSLTALNFSCLSPVSPNNFPNEFPLSEFSKHSSWIFFLWKIKHLYLSSLFPLLWHLLSARMLRLWYIRPFSIRAQMLVISLLSLLWWCPSLTGLTELWHRSHPFTCRTIFTSERGILRIQFIHKSWVIGTQPLVTPLA